MTSISLQILKATAVVNPYRKLPAGSGHDAPSPFVVVSLDNEPLFRTDTVRHNSNPVWNQTVNFDIPDSGAEKLTIDLIDNISLLPDLTIGQVVLPISRVRELCSSTEHNKISEKINDITLELSFRLQDEARTLSKISSTGKRRALLVGINYVNLPKGKGQLAGCWNDVTNMKALWINRFGYKETEMRVLTDEPSTPADRQPTKQNLLDSFEWLLDGALPGDRFAFHFSGHGAQTADTSGDETDGKDETIIPCDFRTAGPLVDDKLNELLVQRLPEGCRLFSVMDCCHSGTGMDLPFEYKETGSDRSLILSRDSNKAGTVNLGFVERKTKPNNKKTNGDVILISGCKDDQTSADANLGGASSGAMTYSLIQALEKFPKKVTYGQLLKEMREILKLKKLQQIPQLSSSKSFDFNSALLAI